jgi:hypothetical protein
MAQHDLDIVNASGAAVRADLNLALAALGSTMKGPSAPPAPLAGMLWFEDDNPSSTRWTLRAYDGAAWIALGVLDATTDIFEPASTAVGLSLIRAADAAAARAAIGAAPVPTVSAGPGEIRVLIPAVAAALVLPAGGTWEYDARLYNFGVLTNAAVGVGAGGATVQAGVAGQNWLATVRRTV